VLSITGNGVRVKCLQRLPRKVRPYSYCAWLRKERREGITKSPEGAAAVVVQHLERLPSRVSPCSRGFFVVAERSK
jgi:hypothetical protein